MKPEAPGTGLEVVESGRALAFSLDDVMRFHGGGSPGGAALGFRALERALALLEPGGRCERRAVEVGTAFPGPGARDAFELVTRAPSDGRYRVDRDLARSDLGPARERFVFVVAHRAAKVELTLRDGIVTGEFASLAFARGRTRDQADRLEVLKRDLAERVIALAAHEVFDAA